MTYDVTEYQSNSKTSIVAAYKEILPRMRHTNFPSLSRRLETVRLLSFLHGPGMHYHRTLLLLHVCHHVGFGGGYKRTFIVGPSYGLTNCLFFLSLPATTLFTDNVL